MSCYDSKDVISEKVQYISFDITVLEILKLQ